MIVTKKEKGATLCEVIQQSLSDDKNYEYVEELLTKAAYALFCFHEYNCIGDEQMSYIDYSPRNIIVLKNKEICLLDPPNEQVSKDPFFDLGVFSFELFRTFFKKGGM